MRLLAVDHFFAHDLDALEDVLAPSDVIVRIPYHRFHSLARRHFPERAFVGVRAAFDDEFEDSWAAFRKLAIDEVYWLVAAYKPDLLVLPSDSIFYFRPVIEGFAELGIPTFVMQKETTISPMTMEKHAIEIGEFIPFMADEMSVCSARHKEFWLRSGADRSRVHVTGQPRFDLYATGVERRSTEGRATLLYLSFDDVAYLPADLGLDSDLSWSDLRLDIESVIASVSNNWDIVVKNHPQQTASRDWLGDRVTRADRLADTRMLIMNADVVVGFQTTALFEAAVAGRPVIYPAWGPVFEQVRSELIPFDEMDGLVVPARSPEEFETLLRLPPDELTCRVGEARAVAEEHLGPVDGRAAERTVALMRPLVASASRPQAVEVRPRRRRRILLLPAVGAGLAAHLMSGRSRRSRLSRLADRWLQLSEEAGLIARSSATGPRQ